MMKNLLFMLCALTFAASGLAQTDPAKKNKKSATEQNGAVKKADVPRDTVLNQNRTDNRRKNQSSSTVPNNSTDPVRMAKPNQTPSTPTAPTTPQSPTTPTTPPSNPVNPSSPNPTSPTGQP